ncbi:hypothetical protein BDP55DRAFT_267843 [Colletotrichum godetiae]|uniref:Uncharacterized protein n=1 Tax=Colletotrichum godetiae TaxID=1209918 RepID=A0AAJ0AXT2_9PEZI|nr:uncharacterized protein BDP55DRAFT_267843 [Colletotrichum godetiae]KAK1691547.1 hypothetical protein BDP55DRAFT_267843 [Colletotrichum godetiae]
MRRHRGPNGPSGPGPLFTGALLLFFPFLSSPPRLTTSFPPFVFFPSFHPRLAGCAFSSRPPTRDHNHEPSIPSFIQPSPARHLRAAPRPPASLACKCTRRPVFPLLDTHDRASARSGRDHNTPARPPQRVPLAQQMVLEVLQDHLYG